MIAALRTDETDFPNRRVTVSTHTTNAIIFDNERFQMAASTSTPKTDPAQVRNVPILSPDEEMADFESFKDEDQSSLSMEIDKAMEPAEDDILIVEEPQQLPTAPKGKGRGKNTKKAKAASQKRVNLETFSSDSDADERDNDPDWDPNVTFARQTRASRAAKAKATEAIHQMQDKSLTKKKK